MERMLVIEAVETARCFEEGVISSTAEANIGSIFGIGFPANTGGAAQYVNGYVGRTGHRCRGLRRPGARAGGDVRRALRAPGLLVEKAEKGETL